MSGMTKTLLLVLVAVVALALAMPAVARAGWTWDEGAENGPDSAAPALVVPAR